MKNVACAECIHGKRDDEPLKKFVLSKICRICLLLVHVLKSIEYTSSSFFHRTDNAAYYELKFSIV